MLGPIFSVIFGIILIILWIPICYKMEVNNKENREETRELKQALANMKTTKANINFDENIEYYGGISADILGLWNNSNNLESYNNYLLNVVKTTREVEIVKVYDKVTKTYVDREQTKYNTESFSKTKHTTNISDRNYNHLVINNIIESHTHTQQPNVTYQFNLYSISAAAADNLYRLSGLLKKGDKWHSNSYEIQLYPIEYGPPNSIPTSILNRKKLSNKFQKWIGRLVVFLVLLFGLYSLISPVEYVYSNLISFIPIAAPLMRLVMDIYYQISFVLAIILTVLLTFIMYIIVNYTILVIVMIAVPFLIKLTSAFLRRKENKVETTL